MTALLPLAGIQVVDCGVGFGAGLLSRMLGGLGAHIVRAEAEDDPFYAIYPAYRHWHHDSVRCSVEDVAVHAVQADILIVGGEDHPDLDPVLGPTTTPWHEGLIVVDLTSEAGPQVEILAQARTGIVFGQFSDRPLHWAFPACGYAAAEQALLGVAAALLDRQATGCGRLVKTSLDQAASMWFSQYWMSAARPDAAFDSMTPRDVRPLIVETSDGKFVHFAMSMPGVLARVHAVFETGVAVDPEDGGYPGAEQGRNFFGDVDLFRAHARNFDSVELLERFRAAGVPAEPVLAIGECWDLEQTQFNGVIEQRSDERVVAPVPFSMSADGGNIAAAGPTADPIVLEFGSFVAGPYATRLLADFGLDVIKVEPLSGDPSRKIFRTSHVTNYGKRSLSIDAKAPEGAAILRRLIARASAVSHNLRPMAASRMGLDFETLAQVRPGIVSHASSAYGEHGPKAAEPGFDYVIQALCGHEVRAGGPGNFPLWYRAPITDYSTGALGAVSVLLGLLHNRQTGASVRIANNLLNVGIFLMSELVVDATGSARGAPSNDVEQLGFNAAERLYRCADGWIAICARGVAMRLRLADLWAIDLDGEDAAALLSGAISGLTVDDTLKLLASREIWATRCQEDGWAMLERRAAAGEDCFIRRSDVRYGDVSCVGPHVRLAPSIMVQRKTGFPRVGEHTREILVELGFTDDEITDLVARGIVRCDDGGA